jgi:hypothetical protein
MRIWPPSPGVLADLRAELAQRVASNHAPAPALARQVRERDFVVTLDVVVAVTVGVVHACVVRIGGQAGFERRRDRTAAAVLRGLEQRDDGDPAAAFASRRGLEHRGLGWCLGCGLGLRLGALALDLVARSLQLGARNRIRLHGRLRLWVGARVAMANAGTQPQREPRRQRTW